LMNHMPWFSFRGHAAPRAREWVHNIINTIRKIHTMSSIFHYFLYIQPSNNFFSNFILTFNYIGTQFDKILNLTVNREELYIIHPLLQKSYGLFERIHNERTHVQSSLWGHSSLPDLWPLPGLNVYNLKTSLSLF